MEFYNCRRCGYETTDRGNLMKHFNRKILCDPKISDIDRESLITASYKRVYKTEDFKCNFCDKPFKVMNSVYRHAKKCCKNPTNINLKDEVEKLQTIIKNQEKVIDSLSKCNKINNSTSITNNNNIINNNINQSSHIHLHLNNFGNENIKAIPDSYIRDLSIDPRYDSLFENMHCDKDFPENHNIRIKSSKRRLLEIFKDNEWKVTPFKNGFDAIIIKLTSIFRDYFRKHNDWAHEDMTNEEINSVLDDLDEIRKLDPKYIKPIIEQFISILETHRDMLNKGIQDKTLVKLS